MSLVRGTKAARDIALKIDGKAIKEECHGQPQNLLVARRWWYRRAPLGFRPTDAADGRALRKCGA